MVVLPGLVGLAQQRGRPAQMSRGTGISATRRHTFFPDSRPLQPLDGAKEHNRHHGRQAGNQKGLGDAQLHRD